ncbi:MAG: FmdB family zinc ribbon protein [Desulfobaccales bacterium]
MAVYDYRCVDCGEIDQRVAGLDDHMALCSGCRGVMLRLNEDIFTPYFKTFPEIEEDSDGALLRQN